MAALVALACGVTGAGAQGPPPDGLPNLRQELPTSLSVGADKRTGRIRLGFDSEVANVGAVALVVESVRSGRRMVARQILEGPGGERQDAGLVGTLHYERAGGHEHWHLEDFDRYELLALRGGQRRRSHKAGFCLGDRESAPRTPGTPVAAPAAFTNRCGLGRPLLRNLRQGISPGWSDIYRAHLEGQWVDVTWLAQGLYVLRHRANPRRLIAESSYADNAASLLVRLTRRAGDRLPRVKVERRCPRAAWCTPRAHR